MFSLTDWQTKKEWVNWGEQVKAVPEEKLLPKTVEELQAIVKKAAEDGKRVRVTGAFHSFSPCARPEEVAVSLNYIRGVINVDKEKRQATLFAGTYLHEIGPALNPHGLALENMGDVQNQSIAGAASTGTHGTGMTLGSVSNQIIAWKWIDGMGEIHEHKRGEDELSQALHISLGLLGILVEVTVQLIPLYGLQEESKSFSFQDGLAQFDQAIKGNRHMEWFLFMGTNKLQQKTLNPIEPVEMSGWQHFKDKLEGKLILNGVFYLLSEWVRKSPKKRAKTASKLAASNIPNTKRVGYSYEVFPKPRGVKFTESEYFVPYDKHSEVLEYLNNELMNDCKASHFPIEVRVQKGELGFLSPTQGKDSLILSFHMYKGVDEKEFFEWVNKTMTKWQGRPHWGKEFYLTAEELHQLYPDLQKFLAIREKYDPKGVFLTDWFEEKFLKKA